MSSLLDKELYANPMNVTNLFKNNLGKIFVYV